MSLQGKRVAILAEKIYEDLELWYPYYRLKEEGATVLVVGSGSAGQFESKHGVPVKVDLQGATEFVLEASNGDAHHWCPEGVWAEARVTLEDGKTLWLDELPVQAVEAALAPDLPFSFTYDGKSSRELLPKWKKTVASAKQRAGPDSWPAGAPDRASGETTPVPVLLRRTGTAAVRR